MPLPTSLAAVLPRTSTARSPTTSTLWSPATVRDGWDVPPVITYVSRQAELAPNEACKTFNMGVGLCLIVAPEDEAAVTEALVALGEKPFRVGECVEGSGKVVYSDER